VNGDKMSVFQVEQDGTLSSLDDIFYPEDAPAEVTVMGDRAVIQPQEALPVEAHATITPVAQRMAVSLPS
jgi:hypothetical protein